MFYDNVERLEVFEKKMCDNLSSADCLNDSSDVKALKEVWINYRTDMAVAVGILREYKELITKLKSQKADDDIKKFY